MDELTKFRFQLEQVQERLKHKPSDRALMKLEEKLKSLLNLINQLGGAPTPTDPPKPTNKSNNTSTLPPSLRQGMLCEARSDGKHWFEATIQSISEDGYKYTVIFTGTAEAFHCSPADVRPLREGASKKRLSIAPAPTQEARKIKDQKAATILGDSTKKIKHTKEEHIQKKEVEHREKQDAWKKFSQKYGIAKKL